MRQTQRLERQFAESMTAWEKSKADATRRRQRKTGSDIGGGAAGQTVAEVVVETQHGDPRYLESARKALTDLRKIWGLDAPAQLAVTTSDPYAALTEAQLMDRLAEQHSLLLRVLGATPPTTKDGGTPPSRDEMAHHLRLVDAWLTQRAEHSLRAYVEQAWPILVQRGCLQDDAKAAIERGQFADFTALMPATPSARAHQIVRRRAQLQRQ